MASLKMVSTVSGARSLGSTIEQRRLCGLRIEHPTL
jgi:hypothetical protein